MNLDQYNRDMASSGNYLPSTHTHIHRGNRTVIINSKTSDQDSCDSPAECISTVDLTLVPISYSEMADRRLCVRKVTRISEIPTQGRDGIKASLFNGPSQNVLDIMVVFNQPFTPIKIWSRLDCSVGRGPNVNPPQYLGLNLISPGLNLISHGCKFVEQVWISWFSGRLRGHCFRFVLQLSEGPFRHGDRSGGKGLEGVSVWVLHQ